MPAIYFIEYAAKLVNKFGVKHTIVMADQALHDTSNGLQEQASHDDDIGILLSCVCVVSSHWKCYGRSRKNYVEQ